MNHAIATAPNNAIKASSEPAAIAHTADRLVAHHMNQDASRAELPAATTTRIATSICILESTPSSKTHDFSPVNFANEFSGTTSPVLRISPGDSVRTTTIDAAGVDRTV
jgi:hypothetical protein